MQGKFNVIDWGGRKTLWVDSDRIDECLAYYRDNNLDGIGVNPMHGYRLKDVSFLQDHNDITGLVVVPSIVDIDLTGISSLKNLRYLSISDNTQNLDLGEFPQLEEFRGDWHRKLQFSGNCVALRSLHLWKYKPKTKDLSELPNLPLLEELGLVQASINSLNGLLRFSALRRLELAYIRNLESLDPAQKLPRLTVLDCDKCSKLQRHEILETANSLRVLRLNACGSINSIGFLKRMSQLEEFRFVDTDVVNGDLSPLLKLERVGFLNKKHFSHTMEEVESIINRNITESHSH